MCWACGPEKALLPIDFRPAGNDTEGNREQYKKAPSPIAVIFRPIFTEVRFLRNENALLPMLVTG